MQYNSQRFNQQQSHQQSDSEIEQYYGSGNLFENQKVSGGYKVVEKSIIKPTIEPFAMLSKIDSIPLNSQKGFISFLILMGLAFLVLLFHFKWIHIGNTFLLGGISFLAWRKLSFEMPANFSHYLSNANVTWKALLRQMPIIDSLMNASRHILFWSVVALSVKTVLLDLFMPSYLTSFLYSLSFIGALVGLALCFGNRQYAFMVQVLTLYSLALMIGILIFVIMYAYMPVATGFTFLFVWTLASYFKEWDKIQKEADLEEKESKE